MPFAALKLPVNTLVLFQCSLLTATFSKYDYLLYFRYLYRIVALSLKVDHVVDYKQGTLIEISIHPNTSDENENQSTHGYLENFIFIYKYLDFCVWFLGR